MRINHFSETRHGKCHGLVTFDPDEREQALAAIDRLNQIRDEQHQSRPQHARRPWTSTTLDSWDGSTMVAFFFFTDAGPVRELFT